MKFHSKEVEAWLSEINIYLIIKEVPDRDRVNECLTEGCNYTSHNIPPIEKRLPSTSEEQRIISSKKIVTDTTTRHTSLITEKGYS
jgi:hypothetical protein